ncbi:SurA N-terminal domain-containing protein [Desulfonatronospira sp.]|uniref:SurA N-terminal domain-containing protein n=1 Tax=Desulfonatronospira sp. TaxID=1962951 RepID=UPI0025B9CCCC|nr:SurA N-terminal domain-containing protein [Desulfonatronospira sp.]
MVRDKNRLLYRKVPFSNKALVLLLTFFFIALPFKTAWSSTPVNRIVAHVNGESITLFDLEKRVEIFLGLFDDISLEDLPPHQRKETRKHVLEQMINDILMRQEAERFQIEVSDSEIQEHIERLKRNNNVSREEFKQHLQRQGMRLEDFEKQIRDSMLRQRVMNIMVRRKTIVTGGEIQEYYDKHQDDFQKQRKIHLKVLVVQQVEDASRILQAIRNGEYDFNQAAQKYSQGPAASEGGDLGMVRWDRLAPEWRDALKDLQAGEISEPFVMQGGGVLLKVREVSAEGSIPLEEVKDEIRNELFDIKLEKRFDEYIQGLRERAVIEVRY